MELITSVAGNAHLFMAMSTAKEIQASTRMIPLRHTRKMNASLNPIQKIHLLPKIQVKRVGIWLGS